MTRHCAIVLLLTICVSRVYSTCNVCSATAHFRCTANNKYQYCDPNNAPVGVEYTCAANTWCSTMYSSICQASSSPPAECTCGICATPPSSIANTIACVSDTQYAICYNDGNITPDTAAINCPTGMRCSPAGTPSSPCVTSSDSNLNTCPAGSGSGSTSTCSQSGRFPVTGTMCKNYVLCTQFENGTWARYTYNCPGTSVFDPAAQSCSTTYVCPA